MTRLDAAWGALRHTRLMVLRLFGRDPYQVRFVSPLKYYRTARSRKP